MLFNYSIQYIYTHFEKEMHKNFRQSLFFSMTVLTLRKDAVKRLSPPQVATCLAILSLCFSSLSLPTNCCICNRFKQKFFVYANCLIQFLEAKEKTGKGFFL